MSPTSNCRPRRVRRKDAVKVWRGLLLLDVRIPQVLALSQRAAHRTHFLRLPYPLLRFKSIRTPDPGLRKDRSDSTLVRQLCSQPGESLSDASPTGHISLQRHQVVRPRVLGVSRSLCWWMSDRGL